MTRLAQPSARPQSFFGPALIIFISANIANLANLAFNMLFARLMSPAEFADLTLLMSIKLGLLSIFSALQFGISEITAKSNSADARSLSARLTKQSLWISMPLCFGLIMAAELIGHILNFENIPALICLFLAIPFFLPMIIYRGFAQGQIHLPKMVGSFQAEWIIRLFGCWLMWTAGFGLIGITCALILSIIAGLFFTIDKADVRALSVKGRANKSIVKITLPYAAIFLAQVLALDGDIFIAKAAFSNEVAGGAAGLLLIQRIFFFAFLSFATILQPFIISQAKSERHAFKSLLKLLGLMCLITLSTLIVISFQPEFFVSAFLGENYAHLAALVLPAAIIGAAMVGVQLIIVAMLARGLKWTPFIMIALALLYHMGVVILMTVDPALEYGALLKLKLSVFGFGLLAVVGYLLNRITRSSS